VDHAKAEDRAITTLDKYRLGTSKVQSLADQRNIARVEQNDLRFADVSRQAMHKADLMPKTIYNSMVIRRSRVLFAFRRKLCATDGLAGIRLKRPKPTPQPAWSPAEAERILNELDPSYVAYATFLRDTGCRAGEAKFLTWDDVDLSRCVAHIRAKDGWKPKSGDRRTVPITPRLRTMLAKHPRRTGWVFTAPLTPESPEVGLQICKRRALEKLKRALKALGLSGHLHTFWRTFISQALMRGVPEAVVREWVGHVDPAILRLYTHVSDEVSSSCSPGLHDVIVAASRHGGVPRGVAVLFQTPRVDVGCLDWVGALAVAARGRRKLPKARFSMSGFCECWCLDVRTGFGPTQAVGHCRWTP
jgi:integrase